MKRFVEVFFFGTNLMKDKENEIGDCFTQRALSNPDHRVLRINYEVRIPVTHLESDDLTFKVIYMSSDTIQLVPIET